LILSLLDYLAYGGAMLIGDAAFSDRAELERCRDASGGDGDVDEIYFVYSELSSGMAGKCEISFRKSPRCAGMTEVTPLYAV
jgi:putative AdoMet-dependent methyltransferase